MNVVIVSGTARAAGGAEKVALNSAVRLAGRGHQVTVAAAHGPIAPEFTNIPNLKVVVAEPEPMPEHPGFVERVQLVWPRPAGKFLDQILAEVKASKDSVVHFHNGYFEFAIPGFRALARSGVPIVYTHHDYGWACPLTGFYDYTLNAHCPLEGGSFTCFRTDCTNSSVEKLIRYSRHFGTHQSSGIGEAVKEHIFISQTSYDKLRPYLGRDARHSFLANATEFERRDRKTVGPNSELVFVGRLTTEKDPIALADAANAIGMPVNFVGDGDLKEQLTERVDLSRVKGWKTAEETANLVSGSRGLVLPSRWLEVAPLVIFEAAALGVPVVVPSDTAAAEFVDHQKTGLVYDRSEKSSLADTLARLKEDQFADTLGEEAYRRFWLDPPTWKKHLDGLEEVYGRVLSAG